MDLYKFKFKWVDDEGNATGFLSKKGQFDGETLVLGVDKVHVSALVGSDHRGRHVVLSWLNEAGQTEQTVIEVTSGSADKLVAMLGRERSRVWAAMHREQLNSEGRGGEYREALCPHCGATLDLTGKPVTPQVSCEFCHTLGTLDNPEGPIKAEKAYRLCDECGMYSKPRKFTIFYFYFLLVIYGFWSKPTWRCPACMRPEAWKMLFGNLLFVVGVPTAITQLFRSYGATDVGGMFPGLDAANIKARNGKFEPAVEDYRRILESQPVSAGVKYNIGLACLHRQDYETAARSFEYSLLDCANYEPAAAALANCYEQLGDTARLAALKKQWGVKDDAESQGETGEISDS